MRKELKAIGNRSRHQFEAVVERFGSKNGWTGASVETVLLRDLTCDGRVVADHVWMTRGKWADGLAPGMRIAFDARVGTYQAGYRGRRDDYDLPSPRTDYKVQRPTRVRTLAVVASDGVLAGDEGLAGDGQLALTSEGDGPDR